MSFDDPFDNLPDENVKEVPVVEEPVVVKSDAVGDGEGKIVLTFKEGAGFDSSWVVVHAASVDDANQILGYSGFGSLLKRTKEVAQFFRGGSTPVQPQQNTGGAPQASQEAPGGEKRFCKHGEMVFKTGVAKATGKPYQLFSCTAPRDQQCKAEFLK